MNDKQDDGPEVVNGQIAVDNSDLVLMEKLLSVHQGAQLKHSDAGMRAIEFLAPHAARVAQTKQAFLAQLDLLREKYRVPDAEDNDEVWELSKTDSAFVKRLGAELRTEMRSERQASEAVDAAALDATIEATPSNQ